MPVNAIAHPGCLERDVPDKSMQSGSNPELMEMCKSATTTVSCEPASVARARRWATTELTSMYRHLGDALIDVQTVVSELVTNAVRARCDRLVLALDGHHGYVRIAATDDAAGQPTKRTPTPDQSSGRGLYVVDALSARWGVDRTENDKTVWADIALTGDLGPTFICRD